MNDNKTNSFLETERLNVLMRGYTIPCVISLLVATLYNIVDQIFIANASYPDNYGSAAGTVVFPPTVVALTLTVVTGDGCYAFVSLNLDSGQKENTHRSVGNSVVLCIVISLILTATYLLSQEPIIAMFDGWVNEEAFVQSEGYFTWISIDIPLYMSGQTLNLIIRSDGNPGFTMISTLIGVVVNIVLDPIFIFGFHQGMVGAVLATVLGQALTAGLAVQYLCHMKAMRLEHRSFHLSAYLIKRFIPLGLCSFLSQISLAVAIAAINNIIQKHGALDVVFDQPEYGQIPMTVVGIVMKFFQVVISIVAGMAAGCIPIVDYDVGANRKDRAASLLKMLLATEAVVGVIAFLIMECFPRQLIAVFEAANESICYTGFAVKAFRIYLCMIILTCVNKATFIYLQSLGKALASTLLSMVHGVVFGMDFVLLLPVQLGLGGVLYSMPVSDVLTFAMSIAVVIYTLKTLKTVPSSGIGGSFAPAYELVD